MAAAKRRRAEEAEDADQRPVEDSGLGKLSMKELVHQGASAGRPMKPREKEKVKKPGAEEQEASEEQREQEPGEAGAEEAGGGGAASGVIAPKVLVVDGRLVVDASSLLVTPAAAGGTGDFQTVYEAHSHVTSASYARRQPTERWSAADTELFYDALRCYGTDFSLFERLFPGRTRRQLKNKFKNEERHQPARVEDALSASHRRLDLSHYQDLAARAAPAPAPSSSPSPSPANALAEAAARPSDPASAPAPSALGASPVLSTPPVRSASTAQAQAESQADAPSAASAPPPPPPGQGQGQSTRR